MNQVVVLAGGLATRMRPLTLTVPKSMLEVAGRPFVAWQLEKLARAGFDDCVMCVGHLSEPLEAFVGDGSRFGLRVRWSREGESRLGTGGALKLASALLEPEFVLTYGDSYLPFDYREVLDALRAHPDAEAVMSVFENGGQFDASNVVIEGDRVARYEKGVRDPAFRFIDYGALGLRRAFATQLPDGASDLAPALAAAVRRGSVRAVVARERFYEIGSPAGLADLEARLTATSHTETS